MTIDESKSGEILQLNVHGKVDANASTEFQNEVLKAFQKSKSVIVNLADVNYISSAGLRALLIGQKTANSKGGRFTIINANPSVIEILRVTGLEKVLSVQ